MFASSIIDIERVKYCTELIFPEFILFSLVMGLFIFLAKAITTLLVQYKDIIQTYNRVEKILSDDKLLSSLLMDTNRSFLDSDIVFRSPKQPKTTRNNQT